MAWLLALLIPVLIIAAIAIALDGSAAHWRNTRHNYKAPRRPMTLPGAADVPEDTARTQLAETKDRANAALALVPDDEAATGLLTGWARLDGTVNHIIPLYKLVACNRSVVKAANRRPGCRGPRVSIMIGTDRVTRGLGEIQRLGRGV